jgi:hypothetical protein
MMEKFLKYSKLQSLPKPTLLIPLLDKLAVEAPWKNLKKLKRVTVEAVVCCPMSMLASSNRDRKHKYLIIKRFAAQI